MELPFLRLSFAFALIVSVAANPADRSVSPVSQPKGRITNGQLAVEEQFPFICSLTIYRPNSAAACTCSLISHEWVLTAAHCVPNDATRAVVSFGSTVRATPSLQVSVNSTNFIVHNNWNSNTLDYDAALLHTEFIEYTANIQPVALPTYCSTCPWKSYVNELATIVGWGRTDANLPSPGKLYFGNARIVKENLLWTYINTHPSSTCYGDSGGPLVVNINGIQTQVGITSFVTHSQCVSGYLAGFTRMYAIMDWIKSKTGIA